MLKQLLTRLEQARGLDPVSDSLQKAVATTGPAPVKDLLHGTWLGHPLHPVLVQVPVGSFVSAAVLDLVPDSLVPGHRRAATGLIAMGVASALPAAAAGLADWAQMTPDRRRVGLVHAGVNTAALGLYAASLVARVRGRHGAGKILAMAGLSLAGAGAYLGGHLSYAQGGGMNQAAGDMNRVPGEWTEIGSLASLPEGEPVVRSVGDVPVLVYRLGDEVSVMVERCSHETGPLGDGEITGSGRDACVICPWHGSTFRLVDGDAVHGPAANGQPMLRSRVVGGRVEVAQP